MKTNRIPDEFQRGCAVIDMGLVRENVVKISEAAGRDKKLICVIKSNAYGHGAVEFARLYETLDQVYGYATATVEEAEELIGAGMKKPILILGYCFPYSYPTIVKNDIRTAVFKKDQAEELDRVAGEMGKKALIHIKVDTGMGRIGVFPDDTGLDFVKYCLSLKNTLVEGIFTHMSKADEVDKTYAEGQIKKFGDFNDRILRETGYEIPIRHMANSAGILELDGAKVYDACRAGIILYGLKPSDDVKITGCGLKPVLSLYSHIAFVKTLKKGSKISYGGIYECPEDQRIATIPLGYADGYPRSLTGKGYVLIRGKKAPIVGKICMDQFMVDVTGIPEAADGDLVTLVGQDGEEEILLDDISALSGRFNYEFVCCLGKRIHRLYTD